MKVTISELRGIIRESLIRERKLASVSDVTRFKPQLKEWVEILVDELADAFPAMKEMTDKARDNFVNNLTDKVSSSLIGLTSGMSYSARKKISKQKEEESHKKWDRQRKIRASGVQYWGDYQA